MKQKITVIATIIVVFFAINKTQAQTVANDNSAIVNNKVQAVFEKTFPNAERTSWMPVKNGYEASFSYNGIETVVGYNKAGRSDYIVERYGADRLSSSVTAMLNDAYKEYDIVNAIEVNMNGRISYLVNIESKKFKKVIRINDDGMDVYQDMAIATH